MIGATKVCLMFSYPFKRVMAGLVTNMITRLRRPLGYWSFRFSLFWEGSDYVCCYPDSVISRCIPSPYYRDDPRGVQVFQVSVVGTYLLGVVRWISYKAYPGCSFAYQAMRT